MIKFGENPDKSLDYFLNNWEYPHQPLNIISYEKRDHYLGFGLTKEYDSLNGNLVFDSYLLLENFTDIDKYVPFYRVVRCSLYDYRDEVNNLTLKIIEHEYDYLDCPLFSKISHSLKSRREGGRKVIDILEIASEMPWSKDRFYEIISKNLSLRKCEKLVPSPYVKEKGFFIYDFSVKQDRFSLQLTTDDEIILYSRLFGYYNYDDDWDYHYISYQD